MPVLESCQVGGYNNGMTACDICGKGVMYGHLVRHSHTGQWMKRATKNRKIFLPNLHKGKVLLDGVAKNVKACASCLAQFKVKYSPKVIVATV